MRIGIDCDGVLRDFIPDLISSIKETHPQHTDKIKHQLLGIGNNGYHSGQMKKLKNMFLKIII